MASLFSFLYPSEVLLHLGAGDSSPRWAEWGWQYSHGCKRKKGLRWLGRETGASHDLHEPYGDISKEETTSKDEVPAHISQVWICPHSRTWPGRDAPLSFLDPLCVFSRMGEKYFTATGAGKSGCSTGTNQYWQWFPRKDLGIPRSYYQYWCEFGLHFWHWVLYW